MKLSPSQFTPHFIRLNDLSFRSWVFEDGMLFGARSKWWGNKGVRSEVHNGLDLRYYATGAGRTETFGAAIRVPIMYPGSVMHCIEDFLGYSLFAEHEIFEDGARLVTAYGHIIPPAEIIEGKFLDEGKAVGTITENPGRDVPPHLHLTAVFVPKHVSVKTISWQSLGRMPDLRFIDPWELI